MSIEVGCGRSCPDCAIRLSKPDSLTDSFCGLVKLDHDARPAIAGLTGDRSTCSGFKPNMATSLRDLAAGARMLVNSAGSLCRRFNLLTKKRSLL